MIVYLHGLNSSSRSHKAAVLREALAPHPFKAPDYPAHRPHAAIARLSAMLRALAANAAPIMLVGSSIGGFYGQYLARQFPVSHLFLINPALRPWELLSDWVAQPMTTAAGETYVLDAETIESTRCYGIEHPCDGDDDGVPTTLLLDQGDEVIDYRIAHALYRDCGRVLAYPGGDHAFQHTSEAAAVILETLRSPANAR
ncbi:MAG: YqiA/YcfP family alpha/beta fold hydrolase [Thiohalocapsa sp.]